MATREIPMAADLSDATFAGKKTNGESTSKMPVVASVVVLGLLALAGYGLSSVPQGPFAGQTVEAVFPTALWIAAAAKRTPNRRRRKSAQTSTRAPTRSQNTLTMALEWISYAASQSTRASCGAQSSLTRHGWARTYTTIFARSRGWPRRACVAHAGRRCDHRVRG